MTSARQIFTAVAILNCCAFLPVVVTQKVAFPETARAASNAPLGAPRPAAAPESRLLADAAGGFGLGGPAAGPGGPLPSAGQTRNLGFPFLAGQGAGASRRRPDCPICDGSVYSYCGDLLLHDACCCLKGNQPLPPVCELADCSFLHAKSCYEHNLITRCCCDRRNF